jgi:hypothetical protein
VIGYLAWKIRKVWVDIQNRVKAIPMHRKGKWTSRDKFLLYAGGLFLLSYIAVATLTLEP